MKYDFKEKTVIITGASSGIGKTLAFKLIRDYGCTVIAIARNEERLKGAKAELEGLSEKYVVTPFDASVEENWINFAKDLENSATYPHVLINCAGVLPKFRSNQSTEEIKKIFDINFFSMVYSCSVLMPILEKSGKGAIINVSSASALCPFGGVSGYTASKVAAERYTYALSCETDMLVSCIMPGFTKTDIMKNQGAKDSDRRLFEKICADPEKSVRKMLRRLKRGKRRIIVGADAHLMNLTYKLLPNRAPKLITWFLRKTKLDLFKEI